MNTDEFSKKYREGNVYIITGPVEHWITTFSTQYWGFTNSNLHKMTLFKKGDIFLFHASYPEYLDNRYFMPSYSDYKFSSGIVGLGVFDRKGHKQTNSWLGEFRQHKRGSFYKLRGQPNHWPNLLFFSSTYWFGKADLIDDMQINKKTNEDIFQDVINLSINVITFKEIKKAGYVIPAQGIVTKLNDIKKVKLLPLIINRLGSIGLDTLKVHYTEIADQDVSSVTIDRHLVTIGNKDIALQTKTEKIKPEYIASFRLKPFLIKNSIKTKNKNKLYIDFDERHEKNSKTGNRGEEIVLCNEKEFLIKLGKMDLANRVKRISLEDTSAGYDILSFDKDGSEKLIEVKTTVLPKRKFFSFNISMNEKTFAEKSNNYYIYLVFDVNGQSPKIATIKNPFTSGMLLLEPTHFIVRGSTE